MAEPKTTLDDHIARARARLDERRGPGPFLMLRLLEGTHQHSALMVTPEVTEWITNRTEAPAATRNRDEARRETQ